ncbi:MAG: flagellar basal body P-ring formation chaperone FlgA [Lautropia sp.]
MLWILLTGVIGALLAPWPAFALPPPATALAIAPATASAPTARNAGAAGPQASPRTGPTTPAVLERWLRQSIKLPGGQRLRVEVEVGTIGSGVRLAPCARAEPFVPGHARLWGRTTIGLRCVEGARWTTYLPVKIAAYGPALVARTALPAGRMVQAADFTVQEIDWAESRSLPVANSTRLLEQELSRPLAAGQPLLTDQLRIPPSIRAGEPVMVVVSGTGFAIGTEAVALANAAEGQRIRVRTGAGKVLEGTVDRKTVKISR